MHRRAAVKHRLRGFGGRDIQAAAIKDGMLYACWSRFIAKTPLPWQDVKWELIYQLESEDNRFRNFAIGPKSIFAECEEYGQYYCQWSSADFSDTPKVTDKIITTIFDHILNRPQAIQRNSDQLHFDKNLDWREVCVKSRECLCFKLFLEIA